jgi:hypothetical protein
MPTIEHNGKQLHVEDKVYEIYNKSLSDRTFAKLIKIDFDQVITTFRLTDREITQLKKLLP